MNLDIIMLTPIIIGAIIGYITNYIAIKMLFKPYKSYRILKLKVPFTPGIIPKQREELARNIANMVSNTLLTKDTIQNKLNTKDFQKILSVIIKTKLNNILDYEIISIISLVPKKLIASFNHYYTIIKNKITAKYKNFIMNNDFENIIRFIIEKGIDDFSRKEIKTLFNEDNINSIFNETIKPLIKQGVNSNTIDSFLKTQINQATESSKNLNEIIPDNVKDVIISKVISQIPHAINEVQNAIFILNLDEKLYFILKDMIIDYISKTNVLLQFFSSVLLVEEWIEENLHNFIREFIYKSFDDIRNKDNMANINKMVFSKIDSFLNIPLRELISKINTEDKNRIEQNIIASLKGYLNKEGFFQNIQTFIIEAFREIKDKPLNSFIQNSKKQINNTLTNTIIATLRKEEVIKQSIILIETKIDEIVYKTKIGKINNIFKIEDNAKDDIAIYIAQKLISITENNLSSIIKTVNMENIVTTKINHFPLDKIENLLLSIMRKHLKWINIFGAILGAILGSMQIIYKHIL